MPGGLRSRLHRGAPRLLAKQGLGTEMRTMLANIYHWFTGASKPPICNDAKALPDGSTAEL
jgi:hypothetical protein